jgi:hypothetical protein
MHRLPPLASSIAFDGRKRHTTRTPLPLPDEDEDEEPDEGPADSRRRCGVTDDADDDKDDVEEEAFSACISAAERSEPAPAPTSIDLARECCRGVGGRPADAAAAADEAGLVILLLPLLLPPEAAEEREAVEAESSDMRPLFGRVAIAGEANARTTRFTRNELRQRPERRRQRDSKSIQAGRHWQPESGPEHARNCSKPPPTLITKALTHTRAHPCLQPDPLCPRLRPPPATHQPQR